MARIKFYNSTTGQWEYADGSGGKMPVKLSELENDSGFVTATTEALINYYTKKQLDELISAIPRFEVKVVSDLPESGNELTIYLVREVETENLYTEYLWVDNTWEELGSQSANIDLSEYAKLDQVDDLIDSHNLVSYAEQSLTEEQQMRVRQNLGLYGYKNEYAMLAGYGPETSGIVWDLGFDGDSLENQAIIEIWDASPETVRHSGVYQRQGEYYNTPSGGTAWKYWLGNLALIKHDSEAWGLFDSYSDEIGYEDAPFVIYQCFNEDTGVEFTRLYIDGEFKPSYWIGFYVYLKSTNPIQVIEKIPEEYLPEVTPNTVQYVEQALDEDQQMQARKNLGLYGTGYAPNELAVAYATYIDNGSSSDELDSILPDAMPDTIQVIIKPTKSDTNCLDVRLSARVYTHKWSEFWYNVYGNYNFIKNIIDSVAENPVPDDEAYPDVPFCLYRYDIGDGDSGWLFTYDVNAFPYDLVGYEVRICDPVNQKIVYRQIPAKYLPDEVLTEDDLPEAVNTALAQAKESGDFDGDDGGHYTPVVTQPTADTMQVAFTPSKDNMPAVDSVTVNLPVGENSGENVNQMEPAEDDIPKVFFGGALQQTKDEAVVPFRYISKTQDISGYAEIKAQGNSSMNYPKKNQTVKLFKDAGCTEKLKVDFKGWGKQNKHCYKANWIDLSHSRNVVSARLWADVVKSRADYAELPELLRTSPNQGVVDGFPIKVYAAGVYQGRYTLNIPKDKWMANMDDELDTHCILCGENYVSGCFRAAANINGNDWTDEIHDTVPESIKTRWNEVISFVMNSTDDDFRANLNQYFYVDSLIDYYLFGLASCGLDAFGKNQIYATYDGQRWIAQMYDMDSTWGLYWNGSKFVSASYGRDEYEDYVHTDGNLLYNRLEQLFYPELQTRWSELKCGALSIENIINRFERFTDIAPRDLVAEDYASTTGGGKFTGIPSQSTNNIKQIRAYALDRQVWTDEYVASLTPVEEVPCTGISLSAESLTFTAAGTQTLTATVTPEGCTDPITWSSDSNSIATVAGGVVTAVANGSCNITATCGDHSATCSVSVSGIESGGGDVDVTPVYSLAEATAFNGSSDYIDTGIQLFDTAKDFTILCDYKSTPTAVSMQTVFHCIKESIPWPGLSLQKNAALVDSTYAVGGYTGGDTSFVKDVPHTATKIAITCSKGSIVQVKYYDNGSIVAPTIPVNTCTEFAKNLLLGCYQDDSGKKGRYWKGTINRFDVYFDVLSDELISAFLTQSDELTGDAIVSDALLFDLDLTKASADSLTISDNTGNLSATVAAADAVVDNGACVYAGYKDIVSCAWVNTPSFNTEFTVELFCFGFPKMMFFNSAYKSLICHQNSAGGGMPPTETTNSETFGNLKTEAPYSNSYGEIAYASGSSSGEALLDDGSEVTANEVNIPGFNSQKYCHIVYCFNADGTITAYANGYPLVNTFAASDFSAWNLDTFKEKFAMFRGAQNTDHILKSARMYNRCLTKDEVRNNLAFEARKIGVDDGVDYTLNPLNGVSWLSGQTYDKKTTGNVVSSTTDIASEKFTLQNCAYILHPATHEWAGILIWNENDEYVGFVGNQATTNDIFFVAKSNYKYAIVVFGTTVDSGLTLMPKNNTVTGVNSFEVDVSDIAVVAGNSCVDITSSELLPGVTNYADEIANSNYFIFHIQGMSASNYRGTGSVMELKEPFLCLTWFSNGTGNIPTKFFGTDADAAKAWFAENGSLIVNAGY